jgi:quinone-modifying oxidoreductase subunit QmoA
VFTLAEVTKVNGAAGNYDVSIKLSPRYVNENCTCCGDCAAACETEIDSDYDFGMKKVKGAYLPFEMAFPSRYVIAPQIIGTDDAQKCADACKYDAVDLSMESKTIDFNVGAIVWSTGWEPYDATKIDNLGFGQYANIITNMMMERLAAPNGPTKGTLCAPRTTRHPKASPLFSAPGQEMKTTCLTVPTSAAWPP